MGKSSRINATILLGIHILISSCSPPDQALNDSIIPQADSLDQWLLSEKISSFTHHLKQADQVENSGLTKQDYLLVIDKQVRAMQKYQDEQGRIIDPVDGEERYFTTPCYAHSIAVLASSGFTTDEHLIESGMKALDQVCENIQKHYAPGNHGDFFTWPLVLAFRHFKSFADTERYEFWEQSIAGLSPEKFYATYRDYRNNWNLVHAAGEFLRHKEGFTPIDYIDTCLYNQLPHFTDYGMYNEWGNPLAYDLFSRHYITGMLALGYEGRYADQYKKIVWKGAWMSLFMQSPHGEVPTGYRSSHHIWNEAEQAMIFEIYAHHYALEGELDMAGAFKRGAMLSLQSIKNWIRPDGSGYIVKNKYPMDQKHGYEDYSKHSCYNMLATSMLAQAWQFAEDKLEEKPCPADVGGYVISIKEPFHKVIAAASGSYIEYDTKGDQLYNPTGIIRIHLKESHPQLGPSDGCASKFSGEGVSISTGPSWKNIHGEWISLAQQQAVESKLEVLEENSQQVSFRICNYVIVYGDTIRLSETIKLEYNKLTVENEIIGSRDSIRISWPMLIENGLNKSSVSLDQQSALLELEGRQICFQVVEPRNTTLSRSGQVYKHRNGKIEPLYMESAGEKLTYTISR